MGREDVQGIVDTAMRTPVYRDVTDEIFKLEYKIARTEEELNELESQIQAAKDIRDFDLVEVLFNKKKIMQEDLGIHLFLLPKHVFY